MQKNQTCTALALVLRNYRKQYHLKSEKLALDLNVDVQTLRRWEQKEATLSDIGELKRIAIILGTDPEALGVTNVAVHSFTGEEIDSFVANIWRLVYEARVAEAHSMADVLVQEFTVQIKGENDVLLHQLAKVHHVAGFVESMKTRGDEIASPLAHYQEMEKIARLLADDTLLSLALAYQGDMHCRGGNVRRGIGCLEAARDTTPHADLAAKGLTLQLLGRAYLKRKSIQDFVREMTEAKRLAKNIQPGINTTYGQYSLGTVYEEYGYNYIHLENFGQAVEYLDKAENILEPTTYWKIVMKTAWAMAFVQSGHFHEGIPLAVEAIELCKKHGLLRLLERMYAVRRYLDRMSWYTHLTSLELQDALDGLLDPPLLRHS